MHLPLNPETMPDPAAVPFEKGASPPSGERRLDAAWLEYAIAVGADAAKLLQLELRLAVGDAKRMVVVALAVLPLLLLTWVGFSVLLAWLAYQFVGSVLLGLVTFVGVQLLALVVLHRAWRRYRKSLRLPLTRQQINLFLQGGQRETPPADA